MSSDGYYKLILKMLETCADSDSLFLEIEYREESQAPALALSGYISTDADEECERKLQTFLARRSRVPKRNFPEAKELIRVLELLGVTTTRESGLKEDNAVTLVLRNTSGVPTMGGKIVVEYET